MFQVQNADFIADKLAAELLPLQEFREVAKNSEEAILRRIEKDGGEGKGRIEFDVDWKLREWENDSGWRICCCDNGDGMTRQQLELYTRTLAVQGAGGNQSMTGNQGMGLKIAGPTRHHKGVLIRSMRDGEQYMVQLGWDPEEREYDFLRVGDGGQKIARVEPDDFPEFIREQGSGTVVTFLGNTDAENTFRPTRDSKPFSANWLLKYLNQRFADLSSGAIDVLVRVPQGVEDEWPKTRGDADKRANGGSGRQFNFNRAYGTFSIWSKVAKGKNGVVDLPGDPERGAPRARIHWWVLPTQNADVTTRTVGGGSLAVLFQNELHDWRRGSQANPLFAQMGITYAKGRFGFALEVLDECHVQSDFARSSVNLDGTPVFQAEAWPVWADQFRKRMPESIEEAITAAREDLVSNDPNREKRISKRLAPVLELLKPRRFRPKRDGDSKAGGPKLTGPGAGDETTWEPPGGPGYRTRRSSKPAGNGLLLSLGDQGEPATEVTAKRKGLEVKWVNEADAKDMATVGELDDRAAALLGADATGADVLLCNLDFRGFKTLVLCVEEKVNPEGCETKGQLIMGYAQEWSEQKLRECVESLRQLENRDTWMNSNYERALSPEALTAAFMADRYHTIREVERSVSNTGRMR
jgi:hypothetical protein